MYLQDIYTYPIKSLGGIRLEQANLEEKGLEYDRRWMLVDKKGKFLSQRKHPKMSLLRTQITDNGILVVQKDESEQQILVPLESSSKPQTAGDHLGRSSRGKDSGPRDQPLVFGSP